MSTITEKRAVSQRTGLNLGLWLILGLVIWSVLQLVQVAPRLPEHVASNFDGSGNPRGFQSKQSFFIVWGLTLAVVAGCFLGAGTLLRLTPVSLVNLPRKDYWFAPERRLQTIAELQRSLSWFGAATMLLIVVVQDAVLEVNLGERETLGNDVLWWLIVYLVATVVWTLRIILHYRRVPESGEAAV